MEQILGRPAHVERANSRATDSEGLDMSRKQPSVMHVAVPRAGRGSLRLGLTLVAMLAAGCSGAGAPSAPPATASAPTTVSTPTSTVSPSAPPTAAPAAMPAGRILFRRLNADEVEDYFTIDTDGSDELALFTLQGCGCARLSPDGTRIWTMGETEHGTYSFTSMGLDGSNREVIAPPSKTLSLGPAATSPDGHWLAFDGWDENHPSRNGLYLGSSDLADLRLVMAVPEGAIRFEPFAVSPDGSRVLFFLEEGPVGGFTHGGGIYIIDADGTGRRQLNPPGSWHGWTGDYAGSLSPDGRRVAFATDRGVFVADLDGGQPERVSDWTGFASVVSWSPTGAWISYTRHEGQTAVQALVRPDGTEERAFPMADGWDGAWSPDGENLLVRRGSFGHQDLWIVDLNGNPIGRVTNEPSSYQGYWWAPA